MSFGSDNHSPVHPLIMQSLVKINHGSHPSYGTDDWTHQCLELCRKELGSNYNYYFVFNGTAANVLALAPLVQTYNSVLCSDVSHLNNDECGAPEKILGCKLIPVPSLHGKIDENTLDSFLIRSGDQHYSQIAGVSITQPSEYGTCYSLEELKKLREWTHQKGLFLHIDGARLVQAASYLKCSLLDLCENISVDSLSFGGTKNGLLFGEIVVLHKKFDEADKKKNKLFFLRKQFMQLPSKQRYIAQQFLTLLKPQPPTQQPLWLSICEQSHQLAQYLGSLLKKYNEIEITQPIEANSVFAKFPRTWIAPLRKTHFFYVWNEKTFEVRLMISFDTQKRDIDRFIRSIEEIKSKTSTEVIG